MNIKSPKDFWAGLMFISFGLFFVIWAYAHYQRGTAVRMGPAYFPILLGGLLTVLGAMVLAQSFAAGAVSAEAKLALPFNIIDLAIAIAIFVVSVVVVRLAGFSSDYGLLLGTLIVCIATWRYRPDAKALVMISAACVVYGYLMKPLGLVGATAALVFVSALGGHEFKWKEVTILYIVLIVFSILVFVKGLTLPFPLWPEALS